MNFIKVSSRTRGFSMKVYFCPAKEVPVTWLNKDGYDTYDIENEKAEIKKPRYISNQFMHACTSYVPRDETRNWSDVYVVSDFDRKRLYLAYPNTYHSEINRVSIRRLPFTDKSCF